MVDTLRFEHYRVDLNDTAPVLSALDKATPIRRFWGRRFHGHTAWMVRWSYVWDSDPEGACALTAHRTVLETVIHMPEREGGDSTAQQAFDTYLAALREHEMGHHAIAQRAARRIDQGLAHLPPQATCEALENEVNRMGERVLDEARIEEKDYDAHTQYGRTQGAWLPR
jgi:predicted secreted Zn-dependent protease